MLQNLSTETRLFLENDFAYCFWDCWQKRKTNEGKWYACERSFAFSRFLIIKKKDLDSWKSCKSFSAQNSLFDILLLCSCCLSLVRLSRCNCSYKSSTTSWTILGKHQIKLNVIMNQFTNLAVHQIMEFRVETVHRTVNADLESLQMIHWNNFNSSFAQNLPSHLGHSSCWWDQRFPLMTSKPLDLRHIRRWIVRWHNPHQ